jgi:hypothetical protein
MLASGMGTRVVRFGDYSSGQFASRTTRWRWTMCRVLLTTAEPHNCESRFTSVYDSVSRSYRRVWPGHMAHISLANGDDTFL